MTREEGSLGDASRTHRISSMKKLCFSIWSSSGFKSTSDSFAIKLEVSPKTASTLLALS
jgi:hypothetical protein